MYNTEPFRYRVIDGYFEEESVRAAEASWPDQNWLHWLRYGQEQQQKRTCNVPAVIPEPCKKLLARMLRIPAGELLEMGHLDADHSLYGGGLHSMYDGDVLGTHLDCDAHPLMPWRRRANAILFLCDWPEWGGRLMLGDGAIQPASNRLVIFECNDVSWHAVEQISSCATWPRMSLAVYFWSESNGTEHRTRAQFR